jgi:hypothetical protein
MREEKARALKEAFNLTLDRMNAPLCGEEYFTLEKIASLIERVILIEGFLVDPIISNDIFGNKKVTGIKSLVTMIHTQKKVENMFLFDTKNADLFAKKKKQVIVKAVPDKQSDPEVIKFFNSLEEIRKQVISYLQKEDAVINMDEALLAAKKIFIGHSINDEKEGELLIKNVIWRDDTLTFICSPVKGNKKISRSINTVKF